MPRVNSKEWNILADALNVIADQIDYPATHQGFCLRKVKVMDAALSKIIQAAAAAQSIIRHNADAVASAVSDSKQTTDS